MFTKDLAMASVGKKITSEKFEEYLVEFSEENKVNIDIPAVMRRLKSARSELEDDMEAYHSFYGDFKLYMENDINAIDSTGNINPTVLNVFTKNKKEEIKNKKSDKEVKEINESNNKFDIEEKLSEEKITERLGQIDFTQINMDDFAFILEYYDEIEDKLPDEEKKKVNKVLSKIFNKSEEQQFLSELVIGYIPEKGLSQEQIERLLELGKKIPGFFEKYELDEDNLEESFAKCSSKILEIDKVERKIAFRLMIFEGEKNQVIPKDYKIHILNDPEIKEALEKNPNSIDVDYFLNSEFTLEEVENLIKEEFENFKKNDVNIIEEGKNIGSIDTIEKINAIEYIFNASNIGDIGENVTPVPDISSINFSSSFENIISQYEQSIDEQYPQAEDVLTQEENNAQMREENDQYVTSEMARAIDFAYATKTMQDIFEKIVEGKSPEILEQEEVEQAEPEEKVQRETKVENIVQKENIPDKIEEPETPKKELEEEEYESPTFDEEDKTGIAGLFAAIANSRVGRAVKNLFKTKDAQKRLNAPVTQRTEDGLKITEYESNGSLMPTTIQARNFLRDFAVNTVEAVTNFANNISDAIRGSKKDEVINKPTIIKSEPVQEQAEKIEQQPVVEQIQEKTETFNDTNKWAVSNESRQRQAELNAAQAQKNSAQVGKIQDKTQEQNRENKESNEGR